MAFVWSRRSPHFFTKTRYSPSGFLMPAGCSRAAAMHHCLAIGLWPTTWVYCLVVQVHDLATSASTTRTRGGVQPKDGAVKKTAFRDKVIKHDLSTHNANVGEEAGSGGASGAGSATINRSIRKSKKNVEERFGAPKEVDATVSGNMGGNVGYRRVRGVIRFYWFARYYQCGARPRMPQLVLCYRVWYMRNEDAALRRSIDPSLEYIYWRVADTRT